MSMAETDAINTISAASSPAVDTNTEEHAPTADATAATSARPRPWSSECTRDEG